MFEMFAKEILVGEILDLILKRKLTLRVEGRLGTTSSCDHDGRYGTVQLVRWR